MLVKLAHYDALISEINSDKRLNIFLSVIMGGHEIELT